MSRGKRYNGEGKLNLKKVFAVIIAIIVIIMFVFVIKMLLSREKGDKVTSESYLVCYEDSKYGVINSKGEHVIAPSYAEYIIIPNEKKDIFLCTYDVNYENGSYKTKALNAKNEEIFKNYEQVEAFDNYDKQDNIYYENTLLKVKKDNKYGIINVEGKEIVGCEYDSITTLKGVENTFIITKEGKQGLIDNNGKVMITPSHKEIKTLGENYKLEFIVVNENNACGIVDSSNKVIVENKYEEIKPIPSESLFVVKENGKWKLINIDGQEVAENKFDNVKSIEGNNVIIAKAGKYGVINGAGEEILPLEYQDIEFAFTNTFIIKKDDKYGLIKNDKTVVFETKYDNFTYIKKADIATASEDGITTDVIGNDLQVKVTGIISEVNVQKAYFRIRVAEDYKYYNFKFEEKKNTEILVNNTLFLTKQDGKYGYTDKNGNVVVKCEYDDAKEQNIYGYAAVMKDGKWGSLDKKGNIALEPTYTLENNTKIDFIAKWHLGQDLNMNYYTK